MFIPVWLLITGYFSIALYCFVIFEMDDFHGWRFWNFLWALLWPIHLVVTVCVAGFIWVLGD